MATGNEIGDLWEIRGNSEVEWTIDDIFSYSKEDEYFNSPCFWVSGVKFYIQICPYGETEEESVGWVSVYLMKDEGSPTRTSVNFTFGVKKADGTVEKLHSGDSWMFDKSNDGFGCANFLERSELLRRRTELAPSDALTLICSLRVNPDFDSAERLDALSENLKDVFLSEKNCDITVKVKNREFPAHKSILAARSPVFAAMLGADMKEKTTGIVNIADCDPEPFENFLKYLYSGTLDNLSSSAIELYKIADKYQVGELKSACVGSIMGNLSVENVCHAILLVHQFDEVGLKKKTQNFFNVNFSKILSTNEWESLMKENTRAANEFLKNIASKMKLVK